MVVVEGYKPPEWRLSFQTLVMLVGFAGVVATWGYAWAILEEGRMQNAAGIERLDARLGALEQLTRFVDSNASTITELDQRIRALEAMTRFVEIYDIRISRLEQHVSESAGVLKTMDSRLNALSSDSRLANDILRRLEEAHGIEEDSRPTRPPSLHNLPQEYEQR